MTDETARASDAAPKAPKDRSPSFPFIPLKSALQRLEAFEAYFGRHPAKADQAGLAWEMKSGSSKSQQTAAALKSFGLVDYEGLGKDRLIKISDLGRTYLRAQQESVKRGAVQKAALLPKWLATFFGQWGADRPPDPVCLDTLVLSHDFTDGAARLFLKVYDQTIAYAGLAHSDKPELGASHSDGVEEDEEESPPAPKIKAGDMVQREVHGVLTFPAPRKVTSVFHDASAGWMVSVDGYSGAYPMHEIQAFTSPALQPAASASAKPDGDTLPPTDDPIETFLSGGRLQINANVGLEGIARLKQILDKYEEILKLMN